jgi:hypothetical protein
MNIKGGNRGEQTHRYGLASVKGQDGTMFHTKCFPGYSGVFCSACKPGTFKYDYSFGVCLPCTNKPKHSYYKKFGESSAICEYECNADRESKD